MTTRSPGSPVEQTAHKDVAALRDNPSGANHERASKALFNDAYKAHQQGPQQEQKFWNTVAKDASKAHLPDLQFDYDKDHNVSGVRDKAGKTVYGKGKDAQQGGDSGQGAQAGKGDQGKGKPASNDPSERDDGYSNPLKKGQGPFDALKGTYGNVPDEKLVPEARKINQATGLKEYKQGDRFKQNEDGSVGVRHDGKDGNYNETTYKDGKAIGDKTHTKTANGYTETEHNLKDKTTTETTREGDNKKSVVKDEKGNVVKTREEDMKTGNWTETKDGKTTKHENDGKGGYTETTTDPKSGQRHIESKDKDGNKTVRDEDPSAGKWTESKTDAKTGLTTKTEHTSKPNEGYEEKITRSDGSSSSTSYDGKTKQKHIESKDKDGNTTVRDEQGDGRYNQTVKDKDGKVTEESKREWKNVLSYEQMETITNSSGVTKNWYDSKGNQYWGEHTNKDNSSLGWKKNSDGSTTSWEVDVKGKRTETNTPATTQ